MNNDLPKLSLIGIETDQFFSSDNVLIYLKLFNIRINSGLITCAISQDHEMRPKVLHTEEWLTNYNNYQFFQLFRMENTTFQTLVDVIGHTDINGILSKTYTGGHYPIDIRSQALIFLWYIATQDTLRSIGSRFKLSPTTVMNVVNRILYFVLRMKKTYIKFPQTFQEMQEISHGFSRYPGTIGALDGTHIFIKVEQTQQDSYIDRYRRHSINLMAVCESHKLFTYIFLGFPGSAHDARVFGNSLLVRDIERFGPNHIFLDEDQYHLIGDTAFGIRKWLMTPYKGNRLTRRERHHNKCLSSDRVVIEHTFGVLKGRWRRLQYINTYNISKTIEIATAACILHNFCIVNADLWDDEHVDEGGHIDQEPVPDRKEGQRKRNHIADVLYNA